MNYDGCTTRENSWKLVVLKPLVFSSSRFFIMGGIKKYQKAELTLKALAFWDEDIEMSKTLKKIRSTTGQAPH